MNRLNIWLAHIQRHLDRMPDPRLGNNRRYRMADAGMAALSVFFLQSPSFLAHQRALLTEQGDSNARTLFGLERIPCDNQIRHLLDTVPSDHFDGLFQHIVSDLNTTGHLDHMRCLDGRLLIALDGTEYFHSEKIHCDHCSSRTFNDGATRYFHPVVSAAIVAPGQPVALPLAPEFVIPQDGHKKQDCERAAAKRWLARIAPHYRDLHPIYLGDDLYACQSICQAIHEAGGHFILTCKAASHRTLYEYLKGLKLPRYQRTVGQGRKQRTYTYHWMQSLPLRDGQDALKVHWVQVEISRQDGAVTYRNAFVTDLTPTRDHVEQIVAAGRARWKIENESFNVLKNRGYHFEHSFGHGKAGLSSVLLALNLLAFALHGACDLVEDLWRQARTRCGARMRLFEHLRSVVCYRVFPSWNELVGMIAGLCPFPRPP